MKAKALLSKQWQTTPSRMEKSSSPQKRNGLALSHIETEKKSLLPPISLQVGICETRMQSFKTGGGGKA